MMADQDRTFGISVRDRQAANSRHSTGAELPAERTIGEKIASIGRPDLIVRIKEPHRQVVVDLAVLNRMRVAGLQNQLVTEVQGINEDHDLAPQRVDQIDSLLSKYCKAIQDWELMEKYSAHANGKHENDPFLITTNFHLQKAILHDANFLDPDQRAYKTKDRENPQLPIGSRPGLRMVRDTQAVVKRFSFALFGGLSLLAPMVLMVLRKDTLTALLTVSVSVLLFAFVVALWAEDVSPSTVVTTVAAYTAVLVVFVGTSS
ncbi:hypothetical protein V493_00001 [Pseudogymnoascus sp. VKM F-4281 (FW-2241)]|nr:hypothetical protein V493_00001 [Pseudogymnoascus sp. VKM F-4281 (FW-2241)]